MSRQQLLGALMVASILVTTPALAAPPQVRLETSLGDITVELYPGDAPQTVSNFMLYVKDDFYADTIFHRVIEGFVIQGGGFTTDFVLKETRDPIANEAGNGLSNLRGTIAMARTSDPHSATSQFYINHDDNPFLDQAVAVDGWGYSVFGDVIAGLDVVDLIAAQPTAPGDAPLELIVIEDAYALEDETTELQKVYVSYYGRPGDPGGVAWWAEQLALGGGDLSAIIQQFGTSPEFDERYGHLDYGPLIDSIYQQMFNRDPDQAGRQFYLGLLEDQIMTLQSITLDILNGALNDDARIIANKLLVATYFTDEVAHRGLSYTSDDIDATRGLLDLVDATPASVEAAMAQAELVLGEM